jgi:hypothetical protein
VDFSFYVNLVPIMVIMMTVVAVMVNIELTLASIIQGVALFFLTDNARAVMSLRHWGAFFYVASGLCVIFIFWSRSIIHTLTLMKWPLEFGHNFFYIPAPLARRFFSAG